MANDVEAEQSGVTIERRGLRRGMYLLPSLFTAANIGMGFYAVMEALHGFRLVGEATQTSFAQAADRFDSAAVAIGLAVLFDTLDGRIARLTKTTSEIGVQLDSIADVLTFGIAPAVLVYAWSYGAVFPEQSAAHKLGWFLSFMFVICGAFRLARFNVQAMRPRVLADNASAVEKKSFVGLPIPAAAGLLAAIIHFAPPSLAQFNRQQSVAYSSLVMLLVVLLSALMISTIRYTSFKSAGATRRSSRIAIVTLVAIGMLIWLFSQYVLLILAASYVLHGVLASSRILFRRQSIEFKTNA